MELVMEEIKQNASEDDSYANKEEILAEGLIHLIFSVVLKRFWLFSYLCEDGPGQFFQ
jgi:hypothetical protein